MHKQAIKPMLRYLTALVLLIPLFAMTGARVTNVAHSRMVVETKSAFQAGDTLAFRFAGRVASRSPNPQHLVFDSDLTSLATGDKAGTFSWDLTCGQAIGFPCGVYDVINTFRLPRPDRPRLLSRRHPPHRRQHHRSHRRLHRPNGQGPHVRPPRRAGVPRLRNLRRLLADRTPPQGMSGFEVSDQSLDP